jgi:hypothetical protein
MLVVSCSYARAGPSFTTSDRRIGIMYVLYDTCQEYSYHHLPTSDIKPSLYIHPSRPSPRAPLQSLLNTISSARRIHSSALHRSTLAPCFRSSTSPISSHARRTTSTSCFVCAAERQNRTRDEIKGVALQRVEVISRKLVSETRGGLTDTQQPQPRSASYPFRTDPTSCAKTSASWPDYTAASARSASPGGHRR